jgi:hypothetical protein
VRRVAVKGGAGESGRGEKFDGFVTEVGCDGFLASAVVAFREGEEKLEGAIVPALSHARRRGAITWHMAFADELPTHIWGNIGRGCAEGA